jgi:hypothetical protein
MYRPRPCILLPGRNKSGGAPQSLLFLHRSRSVTTRIQTLESPAIDSPGLVDGKLHSLEHTGLNNFPFRESHLVQEVKIPRGR